MASYYGQSLTLNDGRLPHCPRTYFIFDKLMSTRLVYNLHNKILLSVWVYSAPLVQQAVLA